MINKSMIWYDVDKNMLYHIKEKEPEIVNQAKNLSKDELKERLRKYSDQTQEDIENSTQQIKCKANGDEFPKEYQDLRVKKLRKKFVLPHINKQRLNQYINQTISMSPPKQIIDTNKSMNSKTQSVPQSIKKERQNLVLKQKKLNTSSISRYINSHKYNQSLEQKLLTLNESKVNNMREQLSNYQSLNSTALCTNHYKRNSPNLSQINDHLNNTQLASTHIRTQLTKDFLSEEKQLNLRAVLKKIKNSNISIVNQSQRNTNITLPCQQNSNPSYKLLPNSSLSQFGTQSPVSYQFTTNIQVQRQHNNLSTNDSQKSRNPSYSSLSLSPIKNKKEFSAEKEVSFKDLIKSKNSHTQLVSLKRQNIIRKQLCSNDKEIYIIDKQTTEGEQHFSFNPFKDSRVRNGSTLKQEMTLKEEYERLALQEPFQIQPRLITKGKFSRINLMNSYEQYLMDRDWIYKANPKYKERIDSNEKLDRILLEKFKQRTIREQKL